MILCVGALGAGKSTLLRVLQQHGQELDEEASSEPAPVKYGIPITTPTVGTDLLTVARCDKVKVNKGVPEDKALVREVGGSMAPIWSSFVEPGKTRAVLYVVDSSSPETIGASTVHLVELLGHPSLEGVSIMIVFSKMDLKASRKLHELKSLMRLEQIMSNGNHDVQEVSFDVEKRENVEPIFDWCMKFKSKESGESS